jgi:hypothetical protein
VTYARAWTPTEEAALRRSAFAGISLNTAAERHGRTPEAIRRRARKLGVELAPEPTPAGGRRWTAQEDQALCALASLPPGRLARLVGRSDRAVRRRMTILGLTNRSPHRLPSTRATPTPGELRLIERESSRDGALPIVTLARRLGRPPAEVLRLAEDMLSRGSFA